ncbi:tRNA pseudouridine(55) synthase TruB [Buchnera aphidicola]|uniref:tRNA pseudouridine(55) synthase TruB n=1 Tax=Buchnera aphidicola TaxID=9 RepID=UPI0031B81005
MHKKYIHGVLFLDKPSNITSNKILQKIKKIFCAKKAGYIGTLDPIATGILPICFGKATKLSEYLVNQKKVYHVIAKLGATTITYDAESIELEKKDVFFTYTQLHYILKKFTGKIKQYVPIYSAVKYKGKPLHKYARENIKTPKISKSVYIYNINCIKYNYQFIELKVSCSKGTYIRTLVHEIGNLLHCGAYVTFLRRTMISSYNVNCSVTMNQLNKLCNLYKKKELYNIFCNLLYSIKSILFKCPKIIVDDLQILYIKENFCFFPFIKTGIFRIIIKNDHNIFILGEINEISQLISYKILNF